MQGNEIRGSRATIRFVPDYAQASSGLLVFAAKGEAASRAHLIFCLSKLLILFRFKDVTNPGPIG